MKRKDVSKELFHNTYHAYIPFYHTQNQEDLSVRGIVGHHDKTSLENFFNTETLSKVTIPQLAEIVALGDMVRLYDVNEAPSMYNLIIDHLENWLYVGNTYGGRYLPPLNDLLALDALAGYLFQYVIFDDRSPLECYFDPTANINQLIEPSSQKNVVYNPYADAFINLSSSILKRGK